MLILFEEYKKPQTKEWNKNITGYEALEMKGKDLAIKVKMICGYTFNTMDII